MLRILAIFLAMSGPALAQHCELPVIPPKLDQARQVCSESHPTTDEARAALAGCSKIVEEFLRLRAPYDKCLVGRLKGAIDDAAQSIPPR
jgi:hypothetical protein